MLTLLSRVPGYGCICNHTRIPVQFDSIICTECHGILRYGKILRVFFVCLFQGDVCDGAWTLKALDEEETAPARSTTFAFGVLVFWFSCQVQGHN